MAGTGFGTTIAFASGFVANITDVKISGLSRESIDVTNFGSPDGYMEFIPSNLIDSGELEVDIQYTPGTTPPITAVPEDVTITFPVATGNTTGATMTCEGFLTNTDEAIPQDDVMTQSITIKFTGERTYDAGA